MIARPKDAGRAAAPSTMVAGRRRARAARAPRRLRKTFGQDRAHGLGDGARGRGRRRADPEFERLNPGIAVSVQQIPWTAAHEKLLTAFAGDATPDVAQLGNSWVPELAALGALAPLDARARPRPRLPRATISRVSGTAMSSTERSTACPWYVDTRLLFYRRDILREAGFPAPPQGLGRLAARDAMRSRRARPRPLCDPAAAQRI